MNWATGMPVETDFIQSRINPSLRYNMEKPCENVHVAPGLNKGYTTEGSNGYNSGMKARSIWKPKTVDELRVDTDPKVSYT
jgi:hypothetical protein